MQVILILLFWIGMIGDYLTTFIGILGGMGVKAATLNNLLSNLNNLLNSGDYAPLLFALVGASAVMGINIMTIDVYEGKKRGMKTMFFFWVPGMALDFICSLLGSISLIKEGANLFLAFPLVAFLTVYITISPILLRHFLNNPID